MNWSDLLQLFQSNPYRGFSVKAPVYKKERVVEQIPLRPLVAKVVNHAEVTEEAEETLELPPPLVKPATKNVVTYKANATNATNVTNVTNAIPVTATTPIMAPVVFSPRPKTIKTLKREIDPIVIGIEQRELLYMDSPFRTKHQMECEEAQRIEGLLNDLYKTQGGRSRGWTKTSLESMIKPRCASGGDIKELDRAKKAFLWPLVIDDKPCSAFLDFLCLAKNIRVAVWFEESKQVVLYPAADNFDSGVSTFPLYNVTCNGLPILGIHTCKDLIQYCDSNKYILMPANSVVSSLTGLNMAELESVGKKLGMTEVTGSKAERVAKVAVYKLRQRLTTVI